MSRNHLILKQHFEIDIGEEASFPRISAILTELMKKEIPDFMDSVMSRYSGKRHIVLEKMEIDLGMLSLDSFREDVLQSFKDAFIQEMDKQVGRQKEAGGPFLHTHSRDIASLLYILKQGRPAWWHTRDTPHLPELLENFLARDGKKTLRFLWQVAANDPIFKARLLRHLPMDRLISIWEKQPYSAQLAHPGEALFWIRLSREIWMSMPGSQQWTDRIKASLVRLILMPPRQWQPQSRRLDPAEFFTGIPLSGWPPALLTQIRQSRAKVQQDGKEFATRFQLPAAASPISELTDFKVFLESGYIPSKSANRRYVDINQLFRFLLDHQLDEVAALIRFLGRNSSVRARFLDRIGVANVRLFFERIAPEKVALFDWIAQAYVAVQETYRPINQTNINVQRSINRFTLELYVQNKLNNLSSEAFMRLHFERMALRYNLAYDQLLDFVLRAIRKRKQQKLYKSPFNIVLETLLSKTRRSPKTVKTPFKWNNISNFGSTNQNEKSPNIKIPLSILKELQVLKSTQLLGRHVTLLHSLLQEQQRIRAKKVELPEDAFPELLTFLSKQLHLDESFLKRVILLQYTFKGPSIRQQPSTGRLKAWLERQASGLRPPSGTAPLIDHLVQHRDLYLPRQLQRLLLPVTGKGKLTRKQGEKIIQLLFPSIGNQLIKSLYQWISVNNRLFTRELADAMIPRFLQLSLAYTEPEKAVARIFQDLLASVSESIRRQLVLPPSVKSTFRFTSPEVSFPDKRRRPHSPARLGIREKQLLTLYELLNLEEELRDVVTPHFLDHILFSFDLLRGKYRAAFLRLLEEKIHIPEVVTFLAEDAQQGLLREILLLLPSAASRRMMHMSRMLWQLMHVLPLFSIPKTERSYFLLTLSLPWYFAPSHALPTLFELFHQLLQQAQQVGWLSPEAAADIARIKDWPAYLEKTWKKQHPTAKSLFASQPILLAAWKQETRDWSGEDISLLLRTNPTSETWEQRLALFRYILQYRTFPEDHPFFPESINRNLPYFRELLQESTELLIHLYSIAHPPAHHPLLLEFLDEELAFVVLTHYSGSTKEEIIRQLAFWSRINLGWSKQDLINRIIRTYLAHPSYRQKKSLSYVTAQALLGNASVHPLELLAMLFSEDADAAIEWVGTLKQPARLWKEIDVFLSITELSDSSLTARMNRWLPIMEVVGAGISASTKMEAFLLFWKQSKKEAGSITDAGVLFWKRLSPMAYLSVTNALQLMIWLRLDGFSVQQLQLIFSDQKTRDHFRADFLLEQAEIRSLEQNASEEKVQERIRTLVSRLMPTESLDKPLGSGMDLDSNLVKHLSRIELEALKRWIESGKGDFPIEAALAVSGPQEWMELLRLAEKATFSLVEFYTQWLKVFQRAPLSGWVDSPEKTLFRMIMRSRIRSSISTTEGNVRLMEILIQSNVLSVTQLPDILLALLEIQGQPWFILDARLLVFWRDRPAFFPSILTWASTHAKDMLPEIEEAVSTFSREDAAADDALQNGPEETSSGNLIEQAPLVSEEKFFRFHSPEPVLTPDLLIWLETGKVAPSGESELRNLAISLPVFKLLMHQRIHPTVPVRLSQWHTPVTLKLQHTLALRLNIRQQKDRLFLLDVFQEFVDKADRPEIERFFLLFRALSQSRERWDRPKFWESLITELLDGKAMKNAFLLITGRWRRSNRLPVWARKLQRRQLKQNFSEPDFLHRLLQQYLETGLAVLKKEGLTFSEFLEALRPIWEKSPGKQLYIFHPLSRKQTARKRLLELFRELGAGFIFEAVHSRLQKDWKLVENIFSKYLSLQLREELGIRSDVELWDRWLYHWSAGPLRMTTPAVLFRDVLLPWLGHVDVARLQSLDKMETANWEEEERRMWRRLQGLLPLLEKPAEKEKKDRKSKEQPKTLLPDEEDAKDGITVYNAGLVLLWPFLTRYFRMLQLADEKGFRDDEAQERAIQLTQFLVTFRTEMDETQLVLNKLLCGAAFTFPVSATFEPTPEERGLSEKMLKGALQNWEQMKTTRPETFQETFLQREGRLYRMDNRWELVVEKKAYDMLLDSLPWNLSMIQLSWMSERLVVIWR